MATANKKTRLHLERIAAGYADQRTAASIAGISRQCWGNLEADPSPNWTMATLRRVARVIGDDATLAIVAESAGLDYPPRDLRKGAEWAIRNARAIEIRPGKLGGDTFECMFCECRWVVWGHPQHEPDCPYMAARAEILGARDEAAP